jgi:indolepyruvate ferredoxin oxidoreductase alpha subunit
MTGFQPSLTTGRQALKSDAPQTPRFSIEETVRGLGVTEIQSVNPFEEQETLEALRKARHGSGVNVVVCHAPCIVHESKVEAVAQQAPLAVDQEVCNACSLCVRLLGCPAILVVDGKYVIDPALCDGCELCADVCQQDAIHPVSPENA